MTATRYDGTVLYGSGIDGDVHVNANPFTLVDPLDGTKNLITANVLQRDACFNSLVVDAGCVLDGMFGAGIPRAIFCAGLLENDGTISWNAKPATGASGGTGGAGNFGASRNGQNGNTAKGTAGLAGTMGGGSQAAGNGTGANTGGAAQPVVITPTLAQLLYFFRSPGTIAGGSSGASGGGDGANSGGGGGAGGPLAFLAAPLILNTGTIEAKGGDGGTPPAGNCGGGSGGGGGGLYLVFSVVPDTGLYIPDSLGTLTLTGGLAGTGIGTGTNGQAGLDGNYFLIRAPLA